MLGAAVWPLWAVELPPPELGGPRPGVDIVVGQAGSQPQSVGEVLAMSTGVIETGGPHITFEATEPGYVYGQQAVFIITGSDQPWRIAVTGTAMALEGGSPDQYIPKTRIEMRDGKKPTGWVSIDGGPMLQNPAGEEDMWMQIEFRIKVEAGDAPGHYPGDVMLEWLLQSGAGGQIPLELHLNVAEFFTVTIEPDLVFPDTQGDLAGWIYSNESTLTVDTNLDFYLAISTGADLVGGNPGGQEIETALRVRQPIGDGTLWDTWGDLGGDVSGQTDPDWAEAFPPGEDAGAPWPGSVDEAGLITTQGLNEIGLTAGAWRASVEDVPGDYTTTITITVSVP